MPHISHDVSTEREAFWKTTEYLHKSLDHLYDAAYREIEEELERLRARANDGETPIHDWSLRVSKAGIEIVSEPLEIWMKGRDWCDPGYCHAFKGGDTLEWLLHLLDSEREGLAKLLVDQVLRGVGYNSPDRLDSFDRALERLPPYKPTPVVLWNDDDPLG